MGQTEAYTVLSARLTAQCHARVRAAGNHVQSEYN